jgi:hypothetical protein
MTEAPTTKQPAAQVEFAKKAAALKLGNDAKNVAAHKAANEIWRTRPKLAAPDYGASALKPLTISIKECVRLSGLGRSTVWKHIKTGTLQSVSVGRKRLVVFGSLEAMLLGREEEKPRQPVHHSFDQTSPP